MDLHEKELEAFLDHRAECHNTLQTKLRKGTS